MGRWDYSSAVGSLIPPSRRDKAEFSTAIAAGRRLVIAPGNPLALPLDESPVNGPMESRARILWMAGLIVLAAIAAYANSFSGAFVYDDVDAILANPTLRHFSTAFAPPEGATVSGRPVLNFSLALSHALSGQSTWGFHGLNLLIHALAGLTLFGIVRRTLGLRGLRRITGRVDSCVSIAFAVALLWAVHPLQTESVTYIVQRAESLAGLFYLLTLYCFIRGDERKGRIWYALSVASCLLGMATKEVMVTAPVIVFLFDRTFISGSFREAWRRHRLPHLALASTWALLGRLIVTTGGNRGGTVGFGIGVHWWEYALTQFQAITRYLELCVWPSPLSFNYGTFWVRGAGEVLPYAIFVLALAAATVIALVRRPALGFLGAWFFVILAPTSSIIPGSTEMIVEHRMYLPLAAVVVLVLIALSQAVSRVPFLAVCGACAALCCALTARRNQDYRSGEALWRDTVSKHSGNPYAHINLGGALFEGGKFAEAQTEAEAAIRLQPELAEAHVNLGNSLLAAGKTQESMAEYTRAVELKPTYAIAHLGMGNAWYQMQRYSEAADQYSEAASLKPGYAVAQCSWGNALAHEGRLEEAILRFKAALRLDPGYADASVNLAGALTQAGRLGDAIAQYQETLRIKPDYAEAHYALGLALNQSSRLPEAIAHFERAVELKPSYAEAHYNLGLILRAMGHTQEAAAHFAIARQLRPDFPAP